MTHLQCDCNYLALLDHVLCRSFQSIRTQRARCAWIFRATGFFAGRPSSLLLRMRHRKASACDRSMRAAGISGISLIQIYNLDPDPASTWRPVLRRRATCLRQLAEQVALPLVALRPASAAVALWSACPDVGMAARCRPVWPFIF
jgi:hypothetical protein